MVFANKTLEISKSSNFLAGDSLIIGIQSVVDSICFECEFMKTPVKISLLIEFSNNLEKD